MGGFRRSGAEIAPHRMQSRHAPGTPHEIAHPRKTARFLRDPSREAEKSRCSSSE